MADVATVVGQGSTVVAGSAVAEVVTFDSESSGSGDDGSVSSVEDETNNKDERRGDERSLPDSVVSDAVKTLLQGANEKPPSSHGKVVEAVVSEFQLPSGHRFYNWNTTHFYPDVHKVDANDIRQRRHSEPQSFRFVDSVSDDEQSSSLSSDVSSSSDTDSENELPDDQQKAGMPVSELSVHLVSQQSTSLKQKVGDVVKVDVDLDSGSGSENDQPKTWHRSPLHVVRRGGRRLEAARNMPASVSDAVDQSKLASAESSVTRLSRVAFERPSIRSKEQAQKRREFLRQRCQAQGWDLEADSRQETGSHRLPPTQKVVNNVSLRRAVSRSQEDIHYIEQSPEWSVRGRGDTPGSSQDEARIDVKNRIRQFEPLEEPVNNQPSTSVKQSMPCAFELSKYQFTVANLKVPEESSSGSSPKRSSGSIRKTTSSFENIYDSVKFEMEQPVASDLRNFEKLWAPDGSSITVSDVRDVGRQESVRPVFLKSTEVPVTKFPLETEVPNKVTSEYVVRPSSASSRSTPTRSKIDAKSLVEEEKQKFVDYRREYRRQHSSGNESGSGKSSDERDHKRAGTEQNTSSKPHKIIPPDDYEYILRKIHHTRHDVVPKEDVIKIAQPHSVTSHVSQPVTNASVRRSQCENLIYPKGISDRSMAPSTGRLDINSSPKSKVIPVISDSGFSVPLKSSEPLRSDSVMPSVADRVHSLTQGEVKVFSASRPDVIPSPSHACARSLSSSLHQESAILGTSHTQSGSDKNWDETRLPELPMQIDVAVGCPQPFSITIQPSYGQVEESCRKPPKPPRERFPPRASPDFWHYNDVYGTDLPLNPSHSSTSEDFRQDAVRDLIRGLDNNTELPPQSAAVFREQYRFSIQEPVHPLKPEQFDQYHDLPVYRSEVRAQNIIAPVPRKPSGNSFENDRPVSFQNMNVTGLESQDFRSNGSKSTVFSLTGFHKPNSFTPVTQSTKQPQPSSSIRLSPQKSYEEHPSPVSVSYSEPLYWFTDAGKRRPIANCPEMETALNLDCRQRVFYCSGRQRRPGESKPNELIPATDERSYDHHFLPVQQPFSSIASDVQNRTAGVSYVPLKHTVSANDTSWKTGSADNMLALERKNYHEDQEVLSPHQLPWHIRTESLPSHVPSQFSDRNVLCRQFPTPSSPDFCPSDASKRYEKHIMQGKEAYRANVIGQADPNSAVSMKGPVNVASGRENVIAKDRTSERFDMTVKQNIASVRLSPIARTPELTVKAYPPSETRIVVSRPERRSEQMALEGNGILKTLLTSQNMREPVSLSQNTQDLESDTEEHTLGVAAIKAKLFGPNEDKARHMFHPQTTSSAPSTASKTNIAWTPSAQAMTSSKTSLNTTSARDTDDRLHDYVSYKDGQLKKRSNILDALTDFEKTYEQLHFIDEDDRRGSFGVPSHLSDDPRNIPSEQNVKRLSITNVRMLEEGHTKQLQSPSLEYTKEWLSSGKHVSPVQTTFSPRGNGTWIVSEAPAERGIPTAVSSAEHNLPRKVADDMAVRKLNRASVGRSNPDLACPTSHGSGVNDAPVMPFRRPPAPSSASNSRASYEPRRSLPAMSDKDIEKWQSILSRLNRQQNPDMEDVAHHLTTSHPNQVSTVTVGLPSVAATQQNEDKQHLSQPQIFSSSAVVQASTVSDQSVEQTSSGMLVSTRLKRQQTPRDVKQRDESRLRNSRQLAIAADSGYLESESESHSSLGTDAFVHQHSESAESDELEVRPSTDDSAKDTGGKPEIFPDMSCLENKDSQASVSDVKLQHYQEPVVFESPEERTKRLQKLREEWFKREVQSSLPTICSAQQKPDKQVLSRPIGSSPVTVADSRSGSIVSDVDQGERKQLKNLYVSPLQTSSTRFASSTAGRRLLDPEDKKVENKFTAEDRSNVSTAKINMPSSPLSKPDILYSDNVITTTEMSAPVTGNLLMFGGTELRKPLPSSFKSQNSHLDGVKATGPEPSGALQTFRVGSHSAFKPCISREDRHVSERSSGDQNIVEVKMEKLKVEPQQYEACKQFQRTVDQPSQKTFHFQSQQLRHQREVTNEPNVRITKQQTETRTERVYKFESKPAPGASRSSFQRKPDVFSSRLFGAEKCDNSDGELTDATDVTLDTMVGTNEALPSALESFEFSDAEFLSSANLSLKSDRHQDFSVSDRQLTHDLSIKSSCSQPTAFVAVPQATKPVVSSVVEADPQRQAMLSAAKVEMRLHRREKREPKDDASQVERRRSIKELVSSFEGLTSPFMRARPRSMEIRFSSSSSSLDEYKDDVAPYQPKKKCQLKTSSSFKEFTTSGHQKLGQRSFERC